MKYCVKTGINDKKFVWCQISNESMVLGRIRHFFPTTMNEIANLKLNIHIPVSKYFLRNSNTTQWSFDFETKKPII